MPFNDLNFEQSEIFQFTEEPWIITLQSQRFLWKIGSLFMVLKWIFGIRVYWLANFCSIFPILCEKMTFWIVRESDKIISNPDKFYVFNIRRNNVTSKIILGCPTVFTPTLRQFQISQFSEETIKILPSQRFLKKTLNVFFVLKWILVIRVYWLTSFVLDIPQNVKENVNKLRFKLLGTGKIIWNPVSFMFIILKVKCN